MKAKTLIMTFALFAVMTGCSKTETSTVVTPAGNKVTLKAYVNNPATKVGFEKTGKFYWSEGDKLGVLDGSGAFSFKEFTLNAEDKGKASGTFTGTIPEGAGFGAYAVYPYNTGHSVSENMLTYDFPASYTYTNMDGDYFTAVQGDGNSFNAPMWGAITDGSVQMKHLGGVFCIKIADMPCTDGTLTLTSDKKISGTYANIDLSAANPAITAAAAATDAEKTVSIKFSGATEKSPGVFYVPAPVGEHNLNIKMVNGESEEQFDTHIGKYEIARSGLQRIYIVTVNGYAFEMKPVKAGTFFMGSQHTDNTQPNYRADAWDDESPVHQVTLTKDYYIGKYEVTQGLWEAVMGDGNWPGAPSKVPSDGYGKGPDYPAYYVTWDDICTETTGFLAKLNSMTGMTFTLPTEAQWEFAAAGGNAGYEADYRRIHLYSGSNTLGDVAWYSDNSEVDGTNQAHPVGQKDPNELGIYDMSGNVWEWCLNWKDNYPTGSAENPTDPGDGSGHIHRGGSWNYGARYCSVSCRDSHISSARYYFLGFRLVLVIP